MFEALTDPLFITAVCTTLTMIVIMFIAERQNNKKPPKQPK